MLGDIRLVKQMGDEGEHCPNLTSLFRYTNILGGVPDLGMSASEPAES